MTEMGNVREVSSLSVVRSSELWTDYALWLVWVGYDATVCRFRCSLTSLHKAALKRCNGPTHIHASLSDEHNKSEPNSLAQPELSCTEHQSNLNSNEPNLEHQLKDFPPETSIPPAATLIISQKLLVHDVS